MSEYTVVVGLGTPRNVKRLMSIGCMMALEFDGRVEGVTVIETDCEAPVATPECHDRMSRAYDVLGSAEQIAEECGARFEGHLAIGRQVAEVLDEMAQSTEAPLIVVGYSERDHPGGDRSDFARLVDDIAAHAPCNLLVARFVGDVSYRRVLVPVREQLNMDVRRDVLIALQHQFCSTVDVVHFAGSETHVPQKLAELEAWLVEREMRDRVELRVEVREDPGEAIVEASADYDLVILGTAPLHEVRRRYFGPVTEYVANNAACSTFLVRTRTISPTR